MVRQTTILFAKDFSSKAEPALRHAVFLARKGRAHLHLLYVFDYGGDLRLPQGRKSHSPRVIEDRVRDLTFAEMARDLERAEGQDLAIVRSLRCGHPVARTIQDYAELIEPDLIVMARHDHWGIVESLAGSLTDKVVRGAACPVFTFKSS